VAALVQDETTGGAEQGRAMTLHERCERQLVALRDHRGEALVGLGAQEGIREREAWAHENITSFFRAWFAHADTPAAQRSRFVGRRRTGALHGASRGSSAAATLLGIALAREAQLDGDDLLVVGQGGGARDGGQRDDDHGDGGGIERGGQPA